MQKQNLRERWSSAHLVGLFVLGIAFTACGYDDRSSENAVIANLKDPLSLEETAKLVKKYNLSPIEMTYSINGISGGYKITGNESVEDGVSNMLSKHNVFLASALEAIEQHIKTSSDKNNIARHNVLRGELEALFQAQLKINALRLRDDANIDNFVKSQGATLVRLAQRELEPSITVKPFSYYHESWAPYYGTSKVTQGQTFQTFYFDYVGDYGSTSTYEHETQVYDRNFADYDNYWSSNLPTAYYDTPFSDSIDNFTVGSAQASSLATYTQYYTHMSLRAGSSSSATVRIKGQKGHRYPSWCYSTWCIFADATTSSLITFTAPVYTNIEWSY